MGKVFTITEGLENLGAMKTGGQGSVYKGRRFGEIITAIKLLPTPIYSESLEDKNYRDFQNEVEKLKKVNEEPNPHVVTILSSGVTDSGNFPFIEMEYIEGPDLEDLLKPPHEPIFTIKEIFKIADQLSDALAHCHRLDVRHGDIKSNNVKFNTRTGNYILLDFGLSAMSDEQRRTSLRHAGAIEFMAPEQNEGQMLFQTDVYSFGVIMFELIAGQVPFPLNDRGETARNNVRLAHLEASPPDMLQLRQAAMPETWTAEKKEREMHVPEWLVSMVYKCLQKNPQQRFSTGVELHDYLVLNSSKSSTTTEADAVQADAVHPGVVVAENEELIREKEQLKRKLLQYEQQAQLKEKEIQELKALAAASAATSHVEEPVPVYAEEPVERGVSKNAFVTLLILTIGLAAFAAYSLFKNTGAQTQQYADSTQNKIDSLVQADTLNKSQNTEETKDRVSDTPNNTVAQKPVIEQNDQQENTADTSREETEEPDQTEQKPAARTSGKYSVISKAYFHDKAHPSTIRKHAFISHWNNAVLTPIGETDDFIYVVFTNHLGQTSRGWLRKADLKVID
ncbi:MAG TPA: serine/threonine-protein kinase [Segetibacter sp.]|jgi:serine/threonine-protein kinase